MHRFVEELRGLPVRDAAGELVGEVVSVAVDVRTWSVGGILVALAGDAAAAFSARHPGREDPVVLLAPAHALADDHGVRLLVPFEVVLARPET